jgi:hypothetical protein
LRCPRPSRTFPPLQGRHPVARAFLSRATPSRASVRDPAFPLADSLRRRRPVRDRSLPSPRDLSRAPPPTSTCAPAPARPAIAGVFRFGQTAASRPPRSVLAVSHRLDGFLRTSLAGLLRPATGPGVRHVSGPALRRAEWLGCPSPWRKSHPSKEPPPDPPYRVTAAFAVLALRPRGHPRSRTSRSAPRRVFGVAGRHLYGFPLVRSP